MSKIFVDGYALVVGVGGDLPNTVQDAEGLADILKDTARCAYPPAQVKLLTGEQATRDNILSSLDELCKTVAFESTVIIYFSGHGYRVTSTTGLFYYLMPFGYNLTQLYKTAVRDDEFTKKLEAITARRLVVLLDCCHAGGIGDPKAPDLELTKSPIPPEARDMLAQGDGRVLIASSQEDELSFSGKPYSAFTLALIEALSGIGVAKKDGYVRVADLAMHAREVVPSRTGGKQRPTLEWGGNKSNNFKLAYYAGGSTQSKGVPFAGEPEIEAEPGAGTGPTTTVIFHNPNWKVGSVYQVARDLTIVHDRASSRGKRKVRRTRSLNDRMDVDDISQRNEAAHEEISDPALNKGFAELYKLIKLLPVGDRKATRSLVDKAHSQARSINVGHIDQAQRNNLIRTLSQVERQAPKIVSPPIKNILRIVSETKPAKYVTDLDQRGLESAQSETVLRYVNVCIERPADHSVVSKFTSLRVETDYDLRMNIGSLWPESVIENAQPNPFPTHLLPKTDVGYWLEVVAVSDDFMIPKIRHNIFLPEARDSWVCSCSPGQDHTCVEQTRGPYLYIAFRSLMTIGSARLRLAVYYQNNLIQSQLLTAQVLKTERNGMGGVKPRKSRQSSWIDYSLTADLGELSYLPPRALNILTNANPDGTHRIVINGALDDAATFNLTEGQMRNAINAVRDKLVGIHVKKYGGQLGSDVQYENLYDANNAKKKDAFIADLKQLAPLGRRLWDLLLADKPDQRRKLREKLLKESATIQVSRTAGSSFVFPWLLVYDIPLESNTKKFKLCRLLNEWDGAGHMINQEKPDCPYKGEHAKNTICPFGFWGFKHIIEQPPSMPEGRNLPTKIAPSNQPPELVVGISLDLDKKLTDKHLKSIVTELKRFSVAAHDSIEMIAEALSNPLLELVYFYCHGQRDPVPGSDEPLPYLGVGKGEVLSTGDLVTWDDADWDDQHWRKTSPLVFINGCHTAEITPESLANFVDTFAGVYASGVIGTEVLVHQRVATEAGFEFLNSFQNNKSVGNALQGMRLKFLLKGNLLGLAYTPYCSAELRLSQ